MSVINVVKLSKKFNGVTAVRGVSFKVHAQEIFGFLGPNGAGKSTTIGMLATLIKPTSGKAWVNGFSVTAQRDAVRKSIGLVFQDPSLDDQLTAEENLRFHARLYGVARSEYARRLQEVLELVELWERRNDLIKTFSGGMKRRLEIARGLIHYPALLFLDEPTLGLDPQTRVHLWDYILKLKAERGMSIFMTTHYMNEAEYCDRIAIIDHGQIVALDTPANLKKQIGGDVVRFRSRDLAKLKVELEVNYQKQVKREDGVLQIEVEQGEQFLPSLIRNLRTPIESIELRKPTLEDVFLSLTGRTIREEAASAKDRMRLDWRQRARR